jgi:hypothetical protein
MMHNSYGDECDRAWGDTVLAVYVAGYSCFFIFFAYRLRNVIEVFGIKVLRRPICYASSATHLPINDITLLFDWLVMVLV